MCYCPICINEMEAGIIENCGKFDKVAPQGLNWVCWPFQQATARLSLKIMQMEVVCDTKTKDNVFCKVVIAVHYKVIDEKVPSAFYKFSDPRAQIRSYVNDVVRSSLPRMDLDDAFASKKDIAEAVQTQLRLLMNEYGYDIRETLVIDIDPDNMVKNAMNEINASQRLREAAAEKAEGEKILQVKNAEAEAESKYLAGLGVAKQRRAIVDGLKSTVKDFSESIDGTGPKDVIDLLLVTQYFDMMKEVGKTQKDSSMFLSHGPSAVAAIRNDLKNGSLMSGMKRS